MPSIRSNCCEHELSSCSTSKLTHHHLVPPINPQAIYQLWPTPIVTIYKCQLVLLIFYTSHWERCCYIRHGSTFCQRRSKSSPLLLPVVYCCHIFYSINIYQINYLNVKYDRRFGADDLGKKKAQSHQIFILWSTQLRCGIGFREAMPYSIRLFGMGTTLSSP